MKFGAVASNLTGPLHVKVMGADPAGFPGFMIACAPAAGHVLEYTPPATEIVSPGEATW